MELDEPEYEINEWIRIVTYTLFIFIIGYVFRGYYIINGIEASLWLYIFWVTFITIYSALKKGVHFVKKI